MDLTSPDKSISLLIIHRRVATTGEVYSPRARTRVHIHVRVVLRVTFTPGCFVMFMDL